MIMTGAGEYRRLVSAEFPPGQPLCIVLVEFSPSGGLFQFAVQLGNALAERGHEVHLLTGPRPELTSSHRRFVIHAVLPTWHPGEDRVRSALVTKPRRALRALQLTMAWAVLPVHVRRLGPDVVLWSTWRFLLDAVGVLVTAATVRRVLLGIVAHEPLPKSDARDTTALKGGRVFTAALAAAWRRMGVVFVLGDKARAAVERHWEPSGSVVLIPHGDEKALRTTSVVPVQQTDPVVLFFGTWQRYKGIDVLLEAFALVRSHSPEARLVVVGAAGADVDLPGLAAAAARAGNVDLRPGYVPVRDVAALFDAARVVAVPYVRAMQSGVAHLAYTFGRPVVATAVGDIPEVVRPGETGLLVPAGDAEKLAEALLAMLRDPAEAARLGSAGRDRVERDSSWPVVAARVEAGLRTSRRTGR